MKWRGCGHGGALACAAVAGREKRCLARWGRRVHAGQGKGYGGIISWEGWGCWAIGSKCGCSTLQNIRNVNPVEHLPPGALGGGLGASGSKCVWQGYHARTIPEKTTGNRALRGKCTQSLQIAA